MGVFHVEIKSNTLISRQRDVCDDIGVMHVKFTLKKYHKNTSEQVLAVAI